MCDRFGDLVQQLQLGWVGRALKVSEVCPRLFVAPVGFGHLGDVVGHSERRPWKLWEAFASRRGFVWRGEDRQAQRGAGKQVEFHAHSEHLCVALVSSEDF